MTAFTKPILADLIIGALTAGRVQVTDPDDAANRVFIDPDLWGTNTPLILFEYRDLAGGQQAISGAQIMAGESASLGNFLFLRSPQELAQGYMALRLTPTKAYIIGSKIGPAYALDIGSSFTPVDVNIEGDLTVAGSIAGGAFRVPNVYASNATWTKPTDGLKGIRVRVVGGGGAGGGCATTGAGQSAEGGGGGGGGYAESVIAAASLGATETVTVGAGGTGVANGAGNPGNASSFGAHVAAGGGSGGSPGSAHAGPQNVNSGSGGVATAGQIQADGHAGSFGRVHTGATRSLAAFGGDSHLGHGARGAFAIGTNGSPGENYGGGGSGAGNGPSTGTTKTGGAGAGGVVIVEYIY